MTPTKLSLALLRKNKCLVAVVEKWNPFVPIEPRKVCPVCKRGDGYGVRQDLFGFGDIIYVTPDGETGLVQTTTSSNLSKRRRKIQGNHNAVIWLKRGNKIVLHAWRKVNGHNECIIEIVTLSPGS